MGRISKTVNFIMTVLFFFISTSAYAELKVESFYPTLGQLGSNLYAELTGTGFDENTRISMYLDSGNRRAIIGSINWSDSDARGIAISGDLVLVADGENGVQVIDISDPQNPQIMDTVPTNYACGLSVMGDYAFLADGTVGLKVIDISNPQDSQVVASLDVSDPDAGANEIAVSGNFAYLANIIGLQIIDISNPQNPQLRGFVPASEEIWGVAVSGDYAYVTDDNNGLKIIDITDPDDPDVTGSLYIEGTGNGLAVAGDYAYIAYNTYDDLSLKVIDISNPQNPQFATSVDMPDMVVAITIQGDKAYMAAFDGGLQVMDIGDPLNPQVIGSVKTFGSAMGVGVIGSYALVADYTSGLQVIDISNPENTRVLGSVDTPGEAYGVEVDGNYAYLADVSGGLQIIDITSDQSPQTVYTMDLSDYFDIMGVTISGDYAYLAAGLGGLIILDISNPLSPLLLGYVSTTYANAVAVAGDYAYIADGNRLSVIDISNPYSPELRGSEDTPPDAIAGGVAVIGDYAYVSCHGDSLQIIDITDPYLPVAIDSVDTPGQCSGIAASGNYIYVADGYSGIQVIDVTDPLNALLIGTVDTPGMAVTITVADDRLYVADLNEGIQIIDISNPLYPQIIGYVDTPGYAWSVDVSGNNLYVADYGYGLVIVPLPNEIDDITVNSPTSISVTLPSPLYAGIYTLRVFNETEESELFGAVSFTDDLSILSSKAIIVAGGGPEASGGTMWEETKLAANRAYDALILQGYDYESIYYISEEILNKYVNETDPDLSDLSYAINIWAANASQLLIYFVDHGQKEEFVLHEDNDTIITLDADTLDDWLDTLQGTMTGPVIFLYDACESGSFISRLRPPMGKERFVITGTSDEPAYFLEDGRSSFSFQFWDKITLNRGNLGDAFLYAKDSMQSYQSARIEADWDYEGNNNEAEDISIAKDKTIQRGGYAYLGIHPFVSSVSDPQFLSSATSATIQAKGVIDSDSVEALVIPPDVNPETSGIPLTDLDIDTIPLTDGDGDHIYTGTYYGFETEGTYTIVVKSKATHELYSYISETTTLQDIYSPPLYTSVTKTSGFQGIEPDTYEEDDSYSQANLIVLNDDEAQAHNFHDVDDADWVKFYGISGQIYKIKAGNVSVVCDPIIGLYDNDGTTLLSGPVDDKTSGKDESLEWTCPEEGIYYVKITNANSYYGENVKYELKVYRPIAGVPGDLTGIVTSSLGVGIGNAVVKSSVGNGTAVTDNDGNYLMVLPSGTHTITVTASGYAAKSQSGVSVEAEGSTTLDFVMSTGGSTDTDTDDGTVDVDDDGGGGGGGGGGGAGIFGAIDINDVIGYHLDGITNKGIRIYMPITRAYKALKGAQTHVEGFAPALADLIRGGFDSLERIAEANKDGMLYRIGSYAFPVLGKIAEFYLDCVGSGELMDNAYSDTMIEVSEFDKQQQQGIAISPHVVKEKGKK